MLRLSLAAAALLLLTRCGGDDCAECSGAPSGPSSCDRAYRTADCPSGAYCSPAAGGTCVAAECGASASGVCNTSHVCTLLSQDVGLCLPACDYGFIGDDYVDDCDDSAADLACQRLGVEPAIVCLPAGTSSSPKVGEAGCHSVDEPCAPGAVCIDSVCHALCRQSQSSPCAVGESCVAGNAAQSFFVCLVD